MARFFILKGLSHEIEMNYKWNTSTEPKQEVNLLQFLKLSVASCIFNGATLLKMSIQVIQYPLTTALEGNQYPLAKDQRGMATLWQLCAICKSFFIMYSRKVQVKYIADTRLQGRSQEKHMVIRRQVMMATWLRYQSVLHCGKV